MDQPLFRVGIIGAGSVVEDYHLPVLNALSQARVMWLCDLNRQRAARLAAAYRIKSVYQQLEQCSEVDVALLAIPLGCRRPVWERLFARGWHVLCEKPFAANVAEHDWIMEAGTAARIQIGAGFMRRTYRGVALARRLVAQSLLGRLRGVWASEGGRLRATGRGSDWYQASRSSAGGGVLMESGCHLIDQVFSICGAQDFTIEHSAIVYHEELDYEARATGTLIPAGQPPCKLAVAVSRLNDYPNQVVLQFDHAQLRIGTAPDAPAQLCTGDGQTVAQLAAAGGAEPATGRAYRAFSAHWCEFFRQCTSGIAALAGAASSRLTTAFIESCYRLNPPPA